MFPSTAASPSRIPFGSSTSSGGSSSPLGTVAEHSSHSDTARRDRLEGGLMRGKPTPESSRTCRDSGAARATDGWRCVVCGRLVIDGLFRWWGGSGQDRRGVARKDRLLLLPRPRNQQALVRGRRGQSGRRPSPARSCSCKGSAGAERRKNRADYGTGIVAAKVRRGEAPRPVARRAVARRAATPWSFRTSRVGAEPLECISARMLSVPFQLTGP